MALIHRHLASGLLLPPRRWKGTDLRRVVWRGSEGEGADYDVRRRRSESGSRGEAGRGRGQGGGPPP